MQLSRRIHPWSTIDPHCSMNKNTGRSFVRSAVWRGERWMRENHRYVNRAAQQELMHYWSGELWSFVNWINNTISNALIPCITLHWTFSLLSLSLSCVELYYASTSVFFPENLIRETSLSEYFQTLSHRHSRMNITVILTKDIVTALRHGDISRCVIHSTSLCVFVSFIVCRVYLFI